MAEEPKYIKLFIESIFDNNSSRELSEHLKSISDYYEYFSEMFNDRDFVTIDKDLVKSFESVYLWLKDRLIVYPPSIKEQVESIIDQSNLLSLFARLSFLSERAYKNLGKLLRIKDATFLSSLILRIMYSGIHIEYNKDKLLTSENILEARISLKRLSQVLKYASTFKFVDYNEDFENYKDHYDPNLIDKNKLIAVINIIKSQANKLPESDNKNKIIHKLDEIEEIVKKKKVRWGTVITGFFILLGFLADLKTLNPSVYDDLYNSTNKAINIIMEDGQVRNKDDYKLLDFYEAKPDATNVKDIDK